MTTVDAAPPENRELAAPRFLLTVLLVVYLLSLLRTGWLSDDAFITLRAVDNLLHGYGLVQNPPERVLGFTNPLWALLLAVPMGLGASAYGSAIGTSIVSAVLGAFIVARGAAHRALGALGLMWLTLSSGYVDFSTSGLENPLSHLLLACLYIRVIRGKALTPSRTPFLLLGLIVMTRLDHVLLALPAVASEVLGIRSARLASGVPATAGRLGGWLRPMVLGLSPLLAWMTFQIIYYGFPYPNTAYAKLNTTISGSTIAKQGVWYLVDSVGRDPITPLLIILAILTGIRSRSRAGLATAIGLGFHLSYLVRVGGDFMAGRFLTAPFLVSVVWLISAGLARVSLREGAAVALVTAAIGWPFATAFKRLPPHGDLPPSGIVSERSFYEEFTGIEHNVRVPKYETHGHWIEGMDYRARGDRVAVRPNVGFAGFAAGPRVHVIDELALTDAFLARLPFSDQRTFRIGHFARRPPDGYVETIRTGSNQIADHCLHDYYDVLTKVIRGPLFTVDRWKSIVALNTGKYDAYVRGDCPP